MDLSALDLPDGLVAATWPLALILLFWNARRVAWARLGECFPTRVWHGGIATAVVLWSMQATVSGNFTFHLLGMAGLTLTLGAPLAMISAALVTAVHIGIHGGQWANVAVVWLTLCATAILTTHAVLRAAERWLPANFFIYIFVVAFFGTALSLASAGVVALLVFAAASDVTAGKALSQYAPYLIQLGFGEAMLTGMIVTLGVVYRPQWVATFDDTRYLRPR